MIDDLFLEEGKKFFHMVKNKFSPLKVGIVGTGYAAQKRAEAIKSDSRAELIVVTGHTPEKLRKFCKNHSVEAVDSWRELVNLPQLDLIFICTINQGCGAIAKAAILAGKHVVVEYPLALEVEVAAEVIELAAKKQKFLHVEHIEIIGGLHQAIKHYLPRIGKVFHACYTTINPQHPAPQNWKYHRAMFGFPLAAALSRVHRLTDLFGQVENVVCNNRYWDLANSDYFTACFCDAHLKFKSGVTARITYGKGDLSWDSDRKYGDIDADNSFIFKSASPNLKASLKPEATRTRTSPNRDYTSQRTFEIYGEQGKILFEGQKGTLILKDSEQEIPVTPRRGLFAQDTVMVLDYLFKRKPLYIQPQSSLYALQVANAAQDSALTGKIVNLN